MTLAQQLARLRSVPVTPGDWRSARSKREACARLEQRIARQGAGKWRADYLRWEPPF